MRTTITLDDDVAVRLEKLRNGRNFKEVVNSALRAGLDRLEQGPVTDEAYSVHPVKGRPRRTDLDNVAQVIAESEEDAYR